MLSFPFSQNTTIELFDSAQNLVVGYAFTSPGSKPDFQDQRWVLYAEYQSPPSTSIVLQTPQNPLLRFSSLANFLSALQLGTAGPLWRMGATYVRVSSQGYPDVPQTEPVPPPFPSLVLPGKPPSISEQIDDHPATLANSTLNVFNGYVFGTQITVGAPGTKQNVEYWAILPSYAPAQETTRVFLRPDSAENHQTLNDFLNDMRRQSGTALVVASCVYAATIPLNP